MTKSFFLVYSSKTVDFLEIRFKKSSAKVLYHAKFHDPAESLKILSVKVWSFRKVISISSSRVFTCHLTKKFRSRTVKFFHFVGINFHRRRIFRIFTGINFRGTIKKGSFCYFTLLLIIFRGYFINDPHFSYFARINFRGCFSLKNFAE